MLAQSVVEIPVGKSHTAIVDSCDLPMIESLPWRPHPSGSGKQVYAITFTGASQGRFMHRLVLPVPPGSGLLIDHINGNGLDNRRCNLRLCEPWQNHKNAGKRKTNTHRFKGVERNHASWSVRLWKNGRRIYIGRYATEIEAAFAYDEAALENFGEFAMTNAMLGLYDGAAGDEAGL